MLARLDQNVKPLRASVDREGTLLRLTGPGQPGIAARVAAIVEEMGYVAQPIETAPPVSRWFDSEEVDELSQEEARVLAGRWVEELAAEAVIEEPHRLVEPLRATLFETFRSAARTGSVEAVRIDVASLGTILGEDDVERVRRWIERRIGHQPE